MKIGILVGVMAVVMVVAAVGAFMMMGSSSNDTPGNGSVTPGESTNPSDLAFPTAYIQTDASQWSYVGGDVGSFGVTDAKAPITKADFKEVWKISDPVDTSSMAWKVPSSAIAVGDKAYFYRGSQSQLCCAEIGTGKIVTSAKCESKSVFNMALTYGDGKIFVCTNTGETTVMKVFDAVTLKQLFVAEPVAGGEVQGTITYKDGKVFFGTYSGDYACFSTIDTDTTRTDEVVKPVWLLKANGWYNATPAFFDDLIVLVQRGFDSGGATAYLMDSMTGTVIDTVSYDREYASSGATAYEGRVYIPLNRVIDRSNMEPDEMTAEHLTIRSMSVTSVGFVRSTEKSWESDCTYGGTQSIPVIWNDSIYIGGGGKTLGSDEPFWIIDIKEDGSMVTRAKLSDVCTKGTASITTAYATKDNGYAVYIYLIEYGHVYPGEAADSTVGYADIFVISDSKTKGTKVEFQLRPDPAQFAFQSFTISEDGYLLIRNDTTLFCYGVQTSYTSADVINSIDRFISMADSDNVNYRDYQRIMSRYAGLSESDKAKVTNYSQLEALCCKVTFKAASGDVMMMVPKGAIIDAPDVAVPSGKVLAGWNLDGNPWSSFGSPVISDIALDPIYADSITVTLDSQNGSSKECLSMAKGTVLPYINEPVRAGYHFDGWCDDSNKVYIPTETIVSSDITIYAMWKKVSTLKFDSDGGSKVTDPYTVVYTKPIESLPIVSKAGCTFLGWYYKDVRYDIGTIYPYESSVTFKAKWEENPDTTITNGNGMYATSKFRSGASITSSKAFDSGYTVTELRKVTSNAECMVVTIKGDGVTEDLPITISIETTAADSDSVKVCYYLSSGVQTVTGKIADGRLTFDATGSSVSGGVQITFGVAPRYGVLNHTG